MGNATSSELRAKCLADTRAQAAQAFARHEITEEGPGRWVLRRRYADGKGFESTYWAEIACMAGGYLYVNGDVDLVVFGRGPADPESRVAWMARAGESYAAEKASIGMGTGAPVHDWEHDIAVARVREAMAADGDDEPELAVPKDFEDAEAVLDDLAGVDSTEEAFAAWLNEHFDWDDCEGRFSAGCVLSSRIIYAQAALARLSTLLDARRGAECGGAP